MSRTIEDLNVKELFDDLDFYLHILQIKSPPFCDEGFGIVALYIKQLKKKLEVD